MAANLALLSPPASDAAALSRRAASLLGPGDDDGIEFDDDEAAGGAAVTLGHRSGGDRDIPEREMRMLARARRLAASKDIVQGKARAVPGWVECHREVPTPIPPEQVVDSNFGGLVVEAAGIPGFVPLPHCGKLNVRDSGATALNECGPCSRHSAPPPPPPISQIDWKAVGDDERRKRQAFSDALRANVGSRVDLVCLDAAIDMGKIKVVFSIKDAVKEKKKAGPFGELFGKLPPRL